MKTIHINLHLSVPYPTSYRGRLVASLAAGFAVVAGLGVGARALAEPTPTPATTFADGERLGAAKLNALVAAVNAANTQLGDPACPSGYTRDEAITSFVSCKRGADEVVKVGTGGSAFWIDRYEASVYANPAGTGTQYGLTEDTEYMAAGFADNGQYTTPLYAVSKESVKPSASITWFQAQAACRLSGKRLPSDEEWTFAASGTSDPGAHPGTGGFCVTSASGPRNTGGGTVCRSRWGAEDMIGNVWEWTSQWYAGVGTTGALLVAWPRANFNGDGTWNVASAAIDTSGFATGLPSAAIRGGAWGNGGAAGLFAWNLSDAASYRSSSIGFRCLLPR